MFTPFHRLVLAVLLIVAGFGAMPLRAQELPSETLQEALIKSSLMTFNDANLTGNYDVFYQRTATPFREQFKVEQLVAAFSEFRELEIDLTSVTTLPAIADEESTVADGVLTMVGHFETTPSQLTYTVRMVPEDNAWRLIGINVKVGDE